MNLLQELIQLNEDSHDVDVDDVWQQLLKYKERNKASSKEPCELTASDEKQYKRDIGEKLKRGWSSKEIFEVMKWTECFDDYRHSEDECLKKIKELTAIAERNAKNFKRTMGER